MALDQDWRMCWVPLGLWPPASLHPLPEGSFWGALSSPASNPSLCAADPHISGWAQSSPASSKQVFAAAGRHASLGHQPSSSFDSVCPRCISGTAFSTLCSASWREDPRLPSCLCKKPESVFHSKLPQIPGSVTESCQFFLLESFLSPSSLCITATCFGLSHQGFSPGLQRTGLLLT